jgi:hypothetical protein
MGSGVTATIPSGSEDSPNIAVGADELAEGLMLVRASTIKVVRLQLAMERRDRRLAFQTVDDLMMLDGKIRDFLNDLPSVASSIAPMQREMEEQRRSLVREKLTLGAGISTSVAAGGVRGWLEPAPSANELAVSEFSEAQQIEVPSGNLRSEANEATSDRGIAPVLRFGILLLLIAMACVGFVLATGAGEDLITGIVHRGLPNVRL